jgi:hypothetical protein
VSCNSVPQSRRPHPTLAVLNIVVQKLDGLATGYFSLIIDVKKMTDTSPE